MKDAFSAGVGIEGLDGGGDLGGGARAGRRFVPGWKLARETNLGTVAERGKWATFTLPPRVRTRFSKNRDRDIEARSNAAVVEVLIIKCHLAL